MTEAAGGTARESSSIGRWLPFGLVALGPMLLFGPMLVRGDVLYWGTPILQFVPWRTYAFALMREGWMPLWNPLLGMGAPLLANYQSALLYPPNWILAFTEPGWGEGLLVLAHLVFAGSGTVLLLRRLHVGTLGQAIGGIAFASGSYLVARAGFFSLNAAASFLPWLVLVADVAGEVSRSKPSPRWLGAIVALAVVIGLQGLAGHAQSMAYSLLFAAAWSVWRAARGGAASIGRLAIIWLAAGLLGLSLAAAQLVPTAEYLAESYRGGGLAEADALTYSFWPWRILGVLLPGLFGSPVVGDYWGYGNYWEDAVYLGVLPLLMALTACLRAGKLGSEAGKTRTFLLIAGALAFLLALGSNTPLFPFLFRHAPLFNAFNAPTRITLITTLCLALLAGLGAELWTRPTGKGLYWARLGTAAAGGVLLLGAVAAALPLGLKESFGRSIASAGFWLLVSGVLALLWPARTGNRWIVLVAAVVTLDLVLSGLGLNPSSSATIYQGAAAPAAPTADDHRRYMFPEEERSLKFERTHRFDSFQTSLDPWMIRASGLPNTSLLERAPSANNFDPLVPARYADWISALVSTSGASQIQRLRLMDVGQVASEAGSEPPWVTYRPIAGARRVRVVPRAVPVDGPAEALSAMARVGFDPEREVVLEASADVARTSGGPGTAELVATGNPDHVLIHVDAPEGGWLVLSDMWFPGWAASIDGVPAAVYPADGAFRGVWVPPGISAVTWEYRPASFRAGLGLTVAGLILVIGASLWWLARRRSV